MNKIKIFGLGTAVLIILIAALPAVNSISRETPSCPCQDDEDPETPSPLTAIECHTVTVYIPGVGWRTIIVCWEGLRPSLYMV